MRMRRPDLTDLIAIEMRGITKAFGDTVANDSVDFSVREGEIHVLLGENGAGKTTLMNILFGHILPDARRDPRRRGGSRDHRPQRCHRARDRHGSSTLQPRALFHRRRERHAWGEASVTDLSFNDDAIEQAVAKRAGELHMPIEPDATVAVLPIDLQQRVEIIKAMYRGAKILILDEPTSLLGPTQIENLLGILVQLRDQGTRSSSSPTSSPR